MTHPAGLPEEATTNRSKVSYTSIGVEVEEALFLDEAEGHGVPAGTPDKRSAFELFADEDELRPAPVETLLAAPSPLRAASASSEDGWISVLNPAMGRPTDQAMELFGRHTNSMGRGIKLVTLFLLVAAMAFGTVQACQVNRAGTTSASSSAR